jgi:hypothetical protein
MLKNIEERLHARHILRASRIINMTDPKPLTEMTDEEIIAEMEKLRERRAQARERRSIESRSPAERSSKKEKEPETVSGDLGDTLDDIFNA